MNPVIEFSHAHPVAAGVVGSLIFTGLILAGVFLSFSANDDQAEDFDLTYWD